MIAGWIFPTLLAILGWGLWVFLPKLAIRSMSPMSLMVYEGIGVALIGVLIAVYLGPKLEFNWKGAGFGVFIGMVGGLGTLGYLLAVSKGPISVVAVTTAFYPALAVILGVVLLGEPFTVKQMFGILFALAAFYLLAS